MLHFYNTLTNRKELFEPLNPPNVRIYVCGPTVYAPSHIGHAMSYIVFDVLRRYLEYSGHTVHHVQNFTDVDDKIILRAQQTGQSWEELGSGFAEDFLRDMRALNVLDAHEYPRASALMPEILHDISRLVDGGWAYEAGGDVYFRVLSDPDYGKLSSRRLDEMRAGARIEPDERKEHPMDFALWKAAKPGEPSWHSPWGPGRPGWHIECTTMSVRTLGEQLDIHGGGNDLIFPHHENEIAQSEALTGKEPFARYWLHNGQLQFDEEKMSKSIGNVITISDLLSTYSADAYRWFVLSSHYRRPISYSETALNAAQLAVRRLAAAASHADGADRTDACSEQRREFEVAMDDDLNTSRAQAVLYGLEKEVNRRLAGGGDPSEPARLLKELGGVLGLRLEDEENQDRDIGPYVDLLVNIRSELRAAKQFALADRVRDGLAGLGVVLEDTPGGTKWSLGL